VFVDIVFLSAAADIFSLSLSLSDEIGKCLLRRRRFDTKVRFAFHERKEGKSVFREKTNREETLTLGSPSATTSSSSSSVTKSLSRSTTGAVESVKT
jgi:hypothetical protein